MAKRKITVTVDEDVLDNLRLLGADNVSGVVNEAVRAHVDRLARLAALQSWVADWESGYGPISPEAAAEAEADLDALDGAGERQTA